MLVDGGDLVESKRHVCGRNVSWVMWLVSGVRSWCLCIPFVIVLDGSSWVIWPMCGGLCPGMQDM